MRKLALFAALVCLISCFGMNAFGQTGSYVGITPPSAAYKGNPTGGLAGLNSSCSSSFSGSHMCTTTEFFATVSFIPGAPPLTVWVQPAVHDCFNDITNPDSTANSIYCQEGGSSSTVPVSNLFINCDGWSSSSASGTGTAATYTTPTRWTLVYSASCNTARRIACCK